MQLGKATGVAGIAAILAAVGAQPAFAGAAGWYLGFGAGRSLSRLDYDRLARELNAPGSNAPPGVLDGSLRVRGYGVDAVGLLPLTERFSAFAKLGETYAQTRDSFSATGVNDHGNVDAWFVSLIFKMGRTPAPMMPVAAF